MAGVSDFPQYLESACIFPDLTSFSFLCSLCSNNPFSLWFSSLALYLSLCYLLISVPFKVGHGELNSLNWVRWTQEGVVSHLLSFSSSSFFLPPSLSLLVYFSSRTLQLHFWPECHLLKNSEKPLFWCSLLYKNSVAYLATQIGLKDK